MKIDELKFGSIISHEGFIAVVTLLKGGESLWISVNDGQNILFIDIEEAEPVILTAKILKSMGFKNKQDHFFGIKLSKKGVSLEVSTTGKRTIIFTNQRADAFKMSVSELKYTKYVHELQNLYYGLEGKRLEIKQPITPHTGQSNDNC